MSNFSQVQKTRDHLHI